MNSLRSNQGIARSSRGENVSKMALFQKRTSLSRSDTGFKKNGDQNLKLYSTRSPCLLPSSVSSVEGFKETFQAVQKYTQSNVSVLGTISPVRESEPVSDNNRVVVIARIPATNSDDIKYDVAIQDEQGRSVLRLTPQEIPDQLHVLQGGCIFCLARDTTKDDENVYFKTMDSRVAGAAVIQDAWHQRGPTVTQGVMMLQAAQMVILRDCRPFNRRFGFVRQGQRNPFLTLKNRLRRTNQPSPAVALYHVITKTYKGDLARRSHITAEQVQQYVWNTNADNCLFSLFLVDNLGKGQQACTLTESPLEVETSVREDSQKRVPSMWHTLIQSQ